ncbi:TonB-dependent receptor [Amphiplicatus metriothermophilus]|uniref:TonB-dependent Receptor Plug Domain n=1 Tax=Amphiplicatus metriothermophilus TaxID=1519374 RepID=A0A239PIZ8_9PROT|nr:TonB-dependent receptor [Amphiplicatus metriothermophilus]MBB5518059.1 outer membrane receptor protein involved in Fe transport [Amphiplicatus metriothermophilus]SNT67607.1 TonB-dependent Receptor Plug Domain [Amphiplicatus metriothermophilus]
MKQTCGLVSVAGRLLSGVALGALAAGGAMAQSIRDEIVVTSQRTEQSLQDVPIAVSAFDGAELQDRQMESFQDIQFNIPNFQFSRTQFTNSAVSIRGIGNFLVAASSENAVSVHVNDVFISSPRLFETEFFDIERIEILRGPQGTLFGRNATGGVMNVITAKANPDQVEGYVDAEYGNYDSVKVHGAVNVPLADTLAVRLAGTTIQRDGYTENVWTGEDIDDRDIYALRGSARWLATDDTTIDFTASYMREEDNRARWQKQSCNAGPLQPLLGCDPNGPRRFDGVDLRGTIASNVSAETFGLIFGPSTAPFGLFSLAGGPVAGEPQPDGLRQVAMDTTPKYDAEETVFLLNAKHDFENFSVKINAGWGNSKIATRTDFDGGVGPELTVPAALATMPGVFALYSDGMFPVSDFDLGIEGPNNGLVGVIGGHVQSRSNRYQAIDLSIGESDYWSVEGIVNTDFDGPLNFLIGANRIESNGFADYAVASTSLDYLALVGGTLTAMGGAADAAAAAVLASGGSPADAAAAAAAASAAAAAQGFGFYKPYFFNDTDDNFLDSTSVFGEVYFDITDTLKLTGGVRHNWDTKGLRDRGDLLDSFIALISGTLPAGVPPVVPLGTPSVRDLLDADELNEGTPGAVNDFRVIEDDFDSTTGRAVLQWTPTDNAQFYASWTRGFKPGGFNPRTLVPGVSLTFEPEVINAYEAGVKSTLANGRLMANLTGFYYDYSGLQVSRIVSRTSINDNVDATIWGLEGEFVWRPIDALTFNMNASYLNTEVGEFSAFDPHNPTAGRTDVELVADIIAGSNCVVTRGAGDGPLLLANGGTPTGVPALDGLIASPFSVCSSLEGNIATINALTGGSYAVVGGIEQDLEGNKLLGAPEFKIAGGVQYDIPVSGGRYTLTPRVDAYYQSEMYTTLFNTEQDRVDGYAYLNAQLRFAPTDGNWHVRFFMQNVTDNDAVTGIYRGDQSSGTSKNLFILEPRRWGFGVGMTF